MFPRRIRAAGSECRMCISALPALVSCQRASLPKCSLTHQKAEQRDFRHAVLSKAIYLSYALLPAGRSFFCVRDVGAMWHLPLRVICRTLCRAGSACPAGINAYCAAGHMGPALRIILRPLRCRASPTGGRRGGRPCPPEQREALPSRCEHWRGNPFPSSLTS